MGYHLLKDQPDEEVISNILHEFGHLCNDPEYADPDLTNLQTKHTMQMHKEITDKHLPESLAKKMSHAEEYAADLFAFKILQTLEIDPLVFIRSLKRNSHEESLTHPSDDQREAALRTYLAAGSDDAGQEAF